MRSVNYLLLLCLIGLLACKQKPQTLPNVYLIGDSTMAEKKADKRPETGWGEKLPLFFEAGIKFENHARNGRSTRSFIAEKRWEAVVNKLEKNDYVFIQFGHNDSKEGTDRYASPADFSKNLLRFIKETRLKQAYPLLLTPVVRRRFDENGNFYDTHGAYPDAVRAVAKQYKVPLVDMHQKSEKLLIESGEMASLEFFLWLEKGENPHYPDGVSDNTHFSPTGAKVMAGLVVEGIKEEKLALEKYLKKP